MHTYMLKNLSLQINNNKIYECIYALTILCGSKKLYSSLASIKNKAKHLKIYCISINALKLFSQTITIITVLCKHFPFQKKEKQLKALNNFTSVSTANSLKLFNI